MRWRLMERGRRGSAGRDCSPLKEETGGAAVSPFSPFLSTAKQRSGGVGARPPFPLDDQPRKKTRRRAPPFEQVRTRGSGGRRNSPFPRNWGGRALVDPATCPPFSLPSPLHATIGEPLDPPGAAATGCLPPSFFFFFFRTGGPDRGCGVPRAVRPVLSFPFQLRDRPPLPCAVSRPAHLRPTPPPSFAHIHRGNLPAGVVCWARRSPRPPLLLSLNAAEDGPQALSFFPSVPGTMNGTDREGSSETMGHQRAAATPGYFSSPPFCKWADRLARKRGLGGAPADPLGGGLPSPLPFLTSEASGFVPLFSFPFFPGPEGHQWERMEAEHVPEFPFLRGFSAHPAMDAQLFLSRHKLAGSSGPQGSPGSPFVFPPPLLSPLLQWGPRGKKEKKGMGIKGSAPARRFASGPPLFLSLPLGGEMEEV